MTNALGSSPTGYSIDSDAATNAWVMNSFQVSSAGTITAVRLWQPGTGLATGMGSSPTAHLWRSTDTSDAQTLTIPVTNTAGWITVTLGTPFAVSPGEYIGIDLQALGGYYVAKAAALPLTANGITIKSSFYRSDGLSVMTGDPNQPSDTSFNGATSYGLDVEFSAAALSPLTFTASKVDSTHVSLAWTPDATVTNGINIARGPGDLSSTLDGAGKSPGDAAYDPTTISGVTTVANAVTTSPYSDTVPSAGTYTYWVNRTA